MTTTNDGKLLAADPGNHRVLIWNDIPQQDGELPDQVLGQPDLGANTPNNPLNPEGPESWLNQPSGNPSADSSSIWVADTNNHRVVGWNFFPIMNGQPANLVLGQADFSKLAKPGQDASLVLGQPSFTANTQNNVAQLSEKSLNVPVGIAGTDSQLLVSDKANARLLFWRQLPQSGQDVPTGVWGQPDFAQAQRNLGGISATSACTPAGLATEGTRLFIGSWSPIR